MGLQTVSVGEQWLSGIAAALRSVMSNTIKTISNDQLVTATGGANIRGGGGYASTHPWAGGLGGFGGFGAVNNIAAANAAANNQNNEMMMAMAMAAANRPRYA
ncbi:MAG TPA: hypothetical protein VGG28_07695 [Kofleriaceae bacterium]